MENTVKRTLQERPVTASTWRPQGIKSGAAWIACAKPSLKRKFLDELSDGELMALPYLFEFWALEHQRSPLINWKT